MSTIKINDRDFHFRDSLGDKGAISQVFSRQDYDIGHMHQTPALFGWIARQKKPPLIIDAGAHIGCATIWFKHQFPTARIVAIEPEPGNFAMLSKNTMGVEGVSTVQGAVASYNGNGYLRDPQRDTWGYRVDARSTPDDGEPGVKMHTVKRLMAMEPGAAPFIAKIDIEGGEAELFARNSAWLADFPLTIVELHDWMLPGQASSRNFLLAVALGNFDVVQSHENLFVFNNDLLVAKP
jgi:FkbM family methyltransferase